MAKLKRLRDGLHRLPPRVAYVERTVAQVDRARAEANPLRYLYKTARWQSLRWSVLVRDDLTCRICGYANPLADQCRMLKAIGRADLLEGKAPELVGDHIIRPQGDLTKFWNPANVQCLCQTCHNTIKQREEAADRRAGLG
jgi:5-methylcytosine-specific restriction enzyme A